MGTPGSIWNGAIPSATIVPDVATAEGVGIPQAQDGILIFIQTKKPQGYYELALNDATAVDGDLYLSTILGGTTRWIKTNITAPPPPADNDFDTVVIGTDTNISLPLNTVSYLGVFRALTAPHTGLFPPAPSAGQRVALKDGDGSCTNVNTITADGNGKNVEDPNVPGTFAATAILGAKGAGAVWEYDGTRWVFLSSTAISATELDAVIAGPGWAAQPIATGASSMVGGDGANDFGATNSIVLGKGAFGTVATDSLTVAGPGANASASNGTAYGVNASVQHENGTVLCQNGFTQNPGETVIGNNISGVTLQQASNAMVGTTPGLGAGETVDLVTPDGVNTHIKGFATLILEGWMQGTIGGVFMSKSFFQRYSVDGINSTITADATNSTVSSNAGTATWTITPTLAGGLVKVTASTGATTVGAHIGIVPRYM